ncbi:MAG: hypothetical protein LBV63_04970 [Candidatus Methanoplasma sp.]|jgi:hypothetical protein|nr:hypothetical protein [Candidatus Methanoplasma sp.]
MGVGSFVFASEPLEKEELVYPGANGGKPFTYSAKEMTWTRSSSKKVCSINSWTNEK